MYDLFLIALGFEIVNEIFYLVAAYMIYDICQKNPRRIKTLKFDEEDYLINGIIWGPIINDLSDLIIGITWVAMGSVDGPKHEHIEMCLHDIGIPGAEDGDIIAMSGFLIVQRYFLQRKILESLVPLS